LILPTENLVFNSVFHSVCIVSIGEDSFHWNVSNCSC